MSVFFLAYHFTGDRLRNGNPLPPVGTWLHYYGNLVPCQKGLHASVDPFDALKYAPGKLLHRVVLGGEMIEHGNPVDKIVCRQRMIIATIDAATLLLSFARQCAADVLDLWDAPDVVRNYLNTGDESIRDAARDAASAAASAAAWSAARDAASAAARDAAWDAARAAANAAANAAAWDAARDAERAAAWSAAWSAARDAQRTRFREMVEEVFASEATG